MIAAAQPTDLCDGASHFHASGDDSSSDHAIGSGDGGGGGDGRVERLMQPVGRGFGAALCPPSQVV
jgi:hypothetical protein